MADVLTKQQRKRCMSANRGKDTKPEIIIRKRLWKQGVRYRLNSKLPGRPDIVFAGKKVVVFVDGCFWHGCPDHFQQPKTNSEFWRQKIEANKRRDKTCTARLEADGWRVLRFWEHEINENPDLCAGRVIMQLKAKRDLIA